MSNCIVKTLKVSVLSPYFRIVVRKNTKNLEKKLKPQPNYSKKSLKSNPCGKNYIIYVKTFETKTLVKWLSHKLLFRLVKAWCDRKKFPCPVKRQDTQNIDHSNENPFHALYEHPLKDGKINRKTKAKHLKFNFCPHYGRFSLVLVNNFSSECVYLR